MGGSWLRHPCLQGFSLPLSRRDSNAMSMVRRVGVEEETGSMPEAEGSGKVDREDSVIFEKHSIF